MPDTDLFSIIDRDTGERFSSTLFSSRKSAERLRVRLALKYSGTDLGIGRVCDDPRDKDVTEEGES